MAHRDFNDQDFDEDAPAVPTPRAAGLGDNKYDGTSNPDLGETADVSVSFHPNLFPRQSGSDSLTEEEAYLS